mmetsp:Transcript_30866/g.65321  ORF Transcript_30866/g.65321 Transcript_30866/m.65321 type:complete len:103 (+) Transcript_30866:134-442(+)
MLEEATQRLDLSSASELPSRSLRCNELESAPRSNKNDLNHDILWRIGNIGRQSLHGVDDCKAVCMSRSTTSLGGEDDGGIIADDSECSPWMQGSPASPLFTT